MPTGLPNSARRASAGPPGVAEAEQLGRLVEGPRRRRRLSTHRAVRTGRRSVTRMSWVWTRPRTSSATNGNVGRVGRQERRQQVPFEMVHSNDRPLQRGCEGEHATPATDQQRARPGPGPRPAGGRVGHAVDITERQRGPRQAPGRASGSTRRMWSRDAQLGHDAAIGLVACRSGCAAPWRKQTRRLGAGAAHERKRRFRRMTTRCPRMFMPASLGRRGTAYLGVGAFRRRARCAGLARPCLRAARSRGSPRRSSRAGAQRSPGSARVGGSRC